MTRTRYTNPIENLRSYIMEKGGLMRRERLADLEWVEDKIKAGDQLAIEAGRLSAGLATDEQKAALDKALRGWKEL